MKAAVFHAPNQPLRVEQVDIDKPKEHEVLVRTVASGVCHSDLHFVEGLWPMETPAVLGHEAAGIVEAVGSSVTYCKPGDRVIACLSVFCGHCEKCLSGHPNMCSARPGRAPNEAPRLSQKGKPVQQFTSIGGYAEKMLLHENGIVKIGNDVPMEVAALIGCGVTTGLGAVLNTAKIEPGSTVAVIGAGGVGLAAIQGARIAGARMIIAVDMNEFKMKTALDLGATHVVDGSSRDPIEAVQRKIEIEGRLFLSEKKLQGSNMGSNRFRYDMPKYIDFYKQGRLKLDEMVTKRRPLEELNEAFRAMKAGEVARTVLMFQ
ncbi:MAG: Zn-dependent alcohol dehydrogenase [Chloroflexi bacterium]|nr:Zn-dependent alcohol dehydrogenase [Chloroflexota bacterium]